MHLSNLRVENFRIFGSAADGKHLNLYLLPGLNLIVGENDAGKTAIMDALRLALGTTSHEYLRINEDDFHIDAHGRATHLTITCTFAGLTPDEEARYLEHLTLGDGMPPLLVLCFDARLAPTGKVLRSLRTGDSVGGTLDDAARDSICATYLRPLRDAEAALTGGRGSRLAQLLKAHSHFRDEGTDDFDPQNPAVVPKKLLGVMRHAEHHIRNNDAVTRTTGALNTDYLSELSLGADSISARIGIANAASLQSILEKLDLGFATQDANTSTTRRGLGLHNALFMAAELLLLGDTPSDALPLLLVEEPEAHLHPQMQLQVASFLRSRCESTDAPPVQAILSTHSPTLASTLPVQAFSIIAGGRAYSLALGRTRLAKDDYEFLSAFLNATKANLFFARGVIIVEGDAEVLLLPTIAEMLGYSLTKLGISIVNVGSRGLTRYARIFQQVEAPPMPTRVACIADRDIVPRSAEGYVQPPVYPKKGKTYPFYDDEYQKEPEKFAAYMARFGEDDADPVRTFISGSWTLEYDLAAEGLAGDLYAATVFAKEGTPLHERPAKRETLAERFEKEMAGLATAAERAAKLYEPLHRKVVSKVQVAQALAVEIRARKWTAAETEARLPKYLVLAIRYAAGE